MSFFEFPEREQRPEAVWDPWDGPPSNELGVVVPVGLVLVRTAELVLSVSFVVVFSEGFSIRLAGRSRAARPGLERMFQRRSPFGDGVESEEVFRFGVQFADGRKATTLNPSSGVVGGELLGPVLLQGNGSVRGGVAEADFWVWPLPPEGPLAFVCEWPSQGVALCRVEIDAGLVLDAAARSEMLWPRAERSAGGGASGSFASAFFPLAEPGQTPDGLS